MIGDNLRLMIAAAITAFIETTGLVAYNYTGGPSYDPTRTTTTDYFTEIHWDEGAVQAITFGSPTGNTDAATAPGNPLTWTAASDGSWPKTIEGQLITNGDHSVLYAVLEFDTPITIPSTGSVMTVTIDYVEGQLAP